MNQQDNEDPVSKLRRQIAELRQTLEHNTTLFESERATLETARLRFGEILKSTECDPHLAELPKLLQGLMTKKMLGALFVGPDGRILMYNGAVQRVLGLGPEANRIPPAEFYDAADRKVIPSSDLPWQKVLRGEEGGAVRAVLKEPDTLQDIHVDISAVGFKDIDGHISGACALFIDVTERVYADAHIKSLCTGLEIQIKSIEAAHFELAELAKRLGEHWTDAITPVPGPADPRHRSKAASSPPQPQPQSAPIAGKVLIVDDIAVNQKLLIMQLKKMGLETDIANNGLEAMNACQKQDYALVFMDLDMPVMNGCEATVAIRKHELENGKHVPIVAMTSFDRKDDRERCLNSGMDDYLAKGASKTQLRQIVDEYVFKRNPQDYEPEPVKVLPANTDYKLDLKSLYDTYGEDEARRILGLFLGSASTMVNCLEIAIDDNDYSSVKHFAYSLKGPCASLGLHYLADLSVKITDNAENGLWVVAAACYKSLKDQFSLVRDQIGPCQIDIFSLGRA